MGLVDGGFKLSRRKRRPDFYRHLCYSVFQGLWRLVSGRHSKKGAPENGCLNKKLLCCSLLERSLADVMWYASVVIISRSTASEVQGELRTVVIPTYPCPCSFPHPHRVCRHLSVGPSPHNPAHPAKTLDLHYIAGELFAI